MKKSYADMDPLEEIRAIREELNREFPTIEAFFDYLRSNSPAKNSVPQPPRKGRRAATKAKANVRPALRQRKTTTHA